MKKSLFLACFLSLFMAGTLAKATTISQIGELVGSTDIPVDTEEEWVLAADVTVTPETAAWWNASTPLVKGGDVTWEGQDKAYSLTVSGGASQAFVLPAPSSSDGYKWAFSGLRGLVVSGITSTGADVHGGAIWVNDTGNSYPLNINSLFFSGNGSVTFSDNKADASASKRAASGGAIYMGGRSVFDMTGNGDILFSGNMALGSSTASNQSANGGALYLAGSTSGSISNNTGNVVFEGNQARSTASGGMAYGGAIFTAQNLELSGNAGKVRFSNNGVEADKQVQGGAIYTSTLGGTLTISGNQGGVEFAGNYVSSLNKSSKSNVFGGAISAQNLSLTDNGDVRFTGNHADSAQANNAYVKGGAIYVTKDLTIAGNGNVVFDGNYEKRGEEVVMVAVKHAITSDAALNLSAGEGKSITFYDALDSGKSYSTAKGNVTASLNAEEGATGSIIFSGAHTRENLAAVWADYTEAALETSLHSKIMAASTTLYHGKLVVEEGATLGTQDFTSNATLSLSNGTFDAAGYTATLSAGSTLALAGVNAMAADKLVVGEGVTIGISLSDAHRDTAALTLTPGASASMADISDKLTLNLDGLSGTRQVPGWRTNY